MSTSACANIVLTSNVPSYRESTLTRELPRLFSARICTTAGAEAGSCISAMVSGALNVSACVRKWGPVMFAISGGTNIVTVAFSRLETVSMIQHTLRVDELTYCPS